MKFKFLAAVAAAASLTVAGCGSDHASPSHAGHTGAAQSANATTSNSTGNGADRAFVADMIPHHESAVTMAKIAQQRGHSQFVKTLADNIIATQTSEIATMRAADAQLAKAGVEEGSLGIAHSMMGMNMDPATLKTASPFDAAFMKMMVPHHQGAVTMAEAELAKGADPQLKQLARSIISAQQREIAQMNDRLKSAGSSGSMGM
ncbi:MAG: hypothetical protein JWO02_3063 [Solirubrobacterales bacterium]|nr:hypothetical protein [Solirubrobacterales bacterium]